MNATLDSLNELFNPRFRINGYTFEKCPRQVNWEALMNVQKRTSYNVHPQTRYRVRIGKIDVATAQQSSAYLMPHIDRLKDEILLMSPDDFKRFRFAVDSFPDKIWAGSATPSNLSQESKHRIIMVVASQFDYEEYAKATDNVICRILFEPYFLSLRDAVGELTKFMDQPDIQDTNSRNNAKFKAASGKSNTFVLKSNNWKGLSAESANNIRLLRKALAPNYLNSKDINAFYKLLDSNEDPPRIKWLGAQNKLKALLDGITSNSCFLSRYKFAHFREAIFCKTQSGTFVPLKETQFRRSTYNKSKADFKMLHDLGTGLK